GEPLDERFDLMHVIGRGGIGEVYLAFDRRLRREVALKTTPVESEASARESLIREAAVMGRLAHPGIVPIYDLSATPGGRVYYTMKRITGWTLDALLDHVRRA